jgi:hypothetical protein
LCDLFGKEVGDVLRGVELAGEIGEGVVVLGQGDRCVELELAALDRAVLDGLLEVGGAGAGGEDAGGTVRTAGVAVGGPMSLENVVGELVGDGARLDEAGAGLDAEDFGGVFGDVPPHVVVVGPAERGDDLDDGAEAGADELGVAAGAEVRPVVVPRRRSPHHDGPLFF